MSLGNSILSKAYCVFNKRTQEVERIIHVKFEDSQSLIEAVEDEELTLKTKGAASIEAKNS